VSHRLLVDAMLSRRLCGPLSDLGFEAAHVATSLHPAAADDEVWAFAKSGRWAIVSKDSDFLDRSAAFGHPPKVIKIETGNRPWRDDAELLSAIADEVRAFLDDEEAASLHLG